MKDYASASDTSSQQSFLIGKPISSHYSLTGRCTRGYIAFDLQNGCMVFLKDQWRSVNRLRSELETYKLLHQKGVRCIATPIAGGDIQSQHTKAQVHVAWVPKRVHTRLVLKEVGRPLLEYKNSTELLATITYAFMGECYTFLGSPCLLFYSTSVSSSGRMAKGGSVTSRYKYRKHHD